MFIVDPLVKSESQPLAQSWLADKAIGVLVRLWLS
jgi:hypothetical protein